MTRVVVWATLALAGSAALSGCALRPGGGPGPAVGSTSAGTSTAHASSVSARAAGSVAGVRANPPGTGAAGKLAEAQRTHEYPAPAPRETIAGGWRSAVEAVQVFTTIYVNWSSRTVAMRLRALAEVSVGQARSALTLEAAQAGRDYELQRGGIANSGTVEAIAPVSGHPDQYAVVTRERTTASHSDAYQGLAPAWHVALATVTRVRGLWVLSAWEPEN